MLLCGHVEASHGVPLSLLVRDVITDRTINSQSNRSNRREKKIIKISERYVNLHIVSVFAYTADGSRPRRHRHIIHIFLNTFCIIVGHGHFVNVRVWIASVHSNKCCNILIYSYIFFKPSNVEM